MAEENVTPAETTGEQTEEQTVTAEQFEELRKQLEETKKAQSGSDRTVAELKKRLEEKEKELSDAGKTAEQKAAERIAEFEKKLEMAERERLNAKQESLAIRLLSDAGITKTPKIFGRLIGNTDEETTALIQDYVEEISAIREAEKDEYVKSNGRKVRDSNTDVLGKSILEMTDAEIASLSPEEFNKKVEAEKAKK